MHPRTDKTVIRKANLDAIINSTSDIIWSISKEYKLISANQAYITAVKNITGKIVKPGDNVLIDNFGDETIDIWKTFYKRALAGENFRDEFVNASTEAISEVSFNPIKHNGKVIAVGCFSRDITMRKKMESQQALFTAIVNSSHDAIISHKADGIITSWNQAAIELFGYSEQEAIGMNISVLSAPQQLKEKSITDERLVNCRHVEHSETRFLRKDKTELSVSLTISCIRDEANNIIGISKIARDNTEKKKAEMRLEMQNMELIKINETLDRFVYSASHELRSPLSSILGLVNLARYEENPLVRLKILQMMESSVNRLDSIISDIVHYSRNSRLDIEVEKLDFKNLISNTIDHLHFMERSDKLKIHYKITGKFNFYSDRKRVAIILNNLLSNAIKYHNPFLPDPAININVLVLKKEALIEVSDNGCGIPTEHIDKIFKMFYRISEKHPGSGIGLFIVKEVLNKLSGNIQVRSKVNKGTTFIITIPNNKPRKNALPS